jgi:CRP/FNR family transcriptional regulator, cyclic AMP receptor protein
MTQADHSQKVDPARALRAIDLFAELEESALAEIARLIKWKSLKKGVEVIAQQAQTDEVYFIASGRVRATLYALSGKEISYQELGAGEMFGELSAIDHKPRTVNVITVRPSNIGVMLATDYWKLMEQHPGIAAATLKRVAGMVRFLIDRVYQYGALDVKDRVRMEVLRMAQDNLVSDNTAEIADFPTHKEIASRVNTHREAVTRELNELSRMGLIAQDHRILKIPSVDKLDAILNESL